MTKKTVSHPGEAMTNYTDKASGVEFNCWIGSYSLERSMWALKTRRCNEGGLRCVEKPKQFGKFLNNKCTGWLNSICGKTMGKKKIMTEIRKCSQFKNTLEEVGIWLPRSATKRSVHEWKYGEFTSRWKPSIAKTERPD